MRGIYAANDATEPRSDLPRLSSRVRTRNNTYVHDDDDGTRAKYNVINYLARRLLQKRRLDFTVEFYMFIYFASATHYPPNSPAIQPPRDGRLSDGGLTSLNYPRPPAKIDGAHG